MDPNVIGRLFVETQPDFDRPVVTRLVVLDVSDESHGNIVGVGFADLTTERLVSKMDPQSFRINTLTSCCLQRSRIPLTLPTDRDVIEAALDTCWRIDPAEARVVVIPNTLELKSLWVSSPLEDEVRAHPHLRARPTTCRCRSCRTARSTRPACFPRASAAATPDVGRGHVRLESLTCRQFALGFRLDEPGRGGNAAVVSSQRRDDLARPPDARLPSRRCGPSRPAAAGRTATCAWPAPRSTLIRTISTGSRESWISQMTGSTSVRSFSSGITETRCSGLGL